MNETAEKAQEVREPEAPQTDAGHTEESRASIVFALMQLNLPGGIFAAESRNDFIEVIKRAELSTFQDGATIIEQGAHADQLYVVLEGAALGNSADGGARIFEKGSIIGRSSMITGKPSVFTVVAGKPGVSVLAIDKDALIGSPVVYRGLLGKGLVINGKAGAYELGKRLGEGFNGPVFELDGYNLCVKIYRPRADSGKAALSPVPADVVQKLKHPHIVALRETVSSYGAQFIIMDMVCGIAVKRNVGEPVVCRTLRQMMDVFQAEQQRVSLEMTAKIFRHAATALLYIHDQGLVHRDIKPEHIFIDIVDNDITFKLSDFSLAFPISTRPGKIVGTPHYCPPEALAIDRPDTVIDGTADFYSLAAVCFELLTAQKVFDSANVIELAQQHLDRQPDLSRLPSTTPIWMGKFIEQSLQKDPSMRLARDEIEKLISVTHPGL